MIELEFVRSTSPRYQTTRERHYIPNRGTHGQQIHFVIYHDGEPAGIISGASSVYAVKGRDDHFGITKDNRLSMLPHIVNNTVFRLEKHVPNLATQVLAAWRRVLPPVWEYLYRVDVIGFETFVIEAEGRVGTVYKADNWTATGTTAGSTKTHNGLDTPFERVKVCPKLIFCKWSDHRTPRLEHIPTWRNEQARRGIAMRRNELNGSRFTVANVKDLAQPRTLTMELLA